MDLDLLPAIDQHTVIPYDLEALAQQAIDRNQDFARRSKITLHYHAETPLPQPLKGHQVLIMQAIDNLVSNAIKYTPAGGHVTICTGTEGDQAFVRVSDNGYGIPANKLTAIFEPFVRIKDEHTANIPGTGLGLNLVKVFVEAHGGQVVVESALNAGSTFSIYLPFEIAEAAQDSASALARVDLSLLVNGGRK
jgi:signal transduction histidine kinase